MDTKIPAASVSEIVEIIAPAAIAFCKAQKRIPERDSDLDDDDDLASIKSVENNQSKRFCATFPILDDQRTVTMAETCFQSPLNVACMLQPKKRFPGVDNVRLNANNAMIGLSPITEISLNMSETTLNSSTVEEDLQGACGGCNDNSDKDSSSATDVTPVKSWLKKKPIGVRKITQFSEMLSQKDNEASTTEDDRTIQLQADNKLSAETKKDKPEVFNESIKSDSCFQLPRHLASSNATNSRGVRHLNMDTSLHEMTVDDLSFYDDDDENDHIATRQRTFPASPQLMGLLSPEGSPQRFHIIEKLPTNHSSTGTMSTKFLQPLSHSNHHYQQQQQQKLPLQQLPNRSSTSSSNTPAKSFRMFHSLSTGSMESSMDDDYMELFEMESLDTQSSLNFPSDLNSLISGQIKHNSSPALCNSLTTTTTVMIKTPEMRRPSVRRCLSMTENHQTTPKTPEFLKKVQEITTTITTTTTPLATRQQAPSASSSISNCCFKRPDPPPSSTNCSPIQSKRYRGEEKENMDGFYTNSVGSISSGPSLLYPSPTSASHITTSTTTTMTRPIFRKCMSMNDAEIMSALALSDCKNEPVLIGDLSKPFVLPLIEGRHADLKSVSSETVARLLRGEYKDRISSYQIIDCRYPYEFEGGHIRGAKNLYTQEQIKEEFLTHQKTEQQQGCSVASGYNRSIIIFHCEFSSERGPKLSRFLRSNDRENNTNTYPALDYPEVYLLHNGYKEFFETHAELCEPIGYRPMLDPSYSEAYRHFRAKSKSWNGDGLGGATSRLKKSRSRLLL